MSHAPPAAAHVVLVDEQVVHRLFYGIAVSSIAIGTAFFQSLLVEYLVNEVLFREFF